MPIQKTNWFTSPQTTSVYDSTASYDGAELSAGAADLYYDGYQFGFSESTAWSQASNAVTPVVPGGMTIGSPMAAGIFLFLTYPTSGGGTAVNPWTQTTIQPTTWSNY